MILYQEILERFRTFQGEDLEQRIAQEIKERSKRLGIEIPIIDLLFRSGPNKACWALEIASLVDKEYRRDSLSVLSSIARTIGDMSVESEVLASFINGWMKFANTHGFNFHHFHPKGEILIWAISSPENSKKYLDMAEYLGPLDGFNQSDIEKMYSSHEVDRLKACLYIISREGGRRYIDWRRVKDFPTTDPLLHLEEREFSSSNAFERSAARKLAWLLFFGRVPNSVTVSSSLTVRQIFILKDKDVFKYFMRLIKNIDKPSRHDVMAAGKLAIAFGQQAEQVLDGTGMSVHDAGINLSDTGYSDELKGFIFAHRKLNYGMAVRIANSWPIVEDGGGTLDMPLRELEVILASSVYTDVLDRELARECAKWGLSQEEFKEVQEFWTSRDLSSESIPGIDFVTDDEYRFYRLSKDDPRGLFLGEYTDCCQHVRGAGSTCAFHGAGNPNGGFYVVERRGEIVAQSWAWRSGSTLVFDNIEVLGYGTERQDAVEHIYTEAARRLLGRLCVQEIRLGCGYSDVDVRRIGLGLGVDSIETPADVYTDARHQVLVATLNDVVTIKSGQGFPEEEGE